jgi:hypothetical protein
MVSQNFNLGIVRFIIASPTMIVKVAIKKVQLSILTTIFSILFLLAFKYYFGWEKV